MIIFEIAGGILLAVFVLRFLHEILAGAGAVLAVLAGLVVVVYAIDGGGRAVVELIICAAMLGVAWLYLRQQLNVDTPEAGNPPQAPPPADIQSPSGRTFRASFLRRVDGHPRGETPD